jgi:hypothetical protein
MRYEAHNGESRFEFERDEPLKEGDTFTQFTMIYKVRRVLSEDDDFAIIEVEHVGGHGQSGHLAPSPPRLGSNRGR